MEFHEKIKVARKAKKMTQEQVALKAGVSIRTYKYYESGEVLPRSQEGYIALSQVLDLAPSYLYTIREEFIDQAVGRYGESARLEAQEMLMRINGLFAGGALSEEDKEEVVSAMKEMFFDAKERTIKR